jgi:hypothetical protein
MMMSSADVVVRVLLWMKLVMLVRVLLLSSHIYAALSATAKARARALPTGMSTYVTIDEFLGAAAAGETEQVLFLLQRGSVDGSYGYRLAFETAAEYGRVPLLRALLRCRQVDPGSTRNYALRMAALCGHVEAVRLLLGDRRVDPGEYGNYALRMAAKQGSAKIVKLLLAHPRVNSRAMGSEALVEAAVAGHVHVVRALLRDGRACPNACRSAALLHAPSPTIIRLLLKDSRTALTPEITKHAMLLACKKPTLGPLKAMLLDHRFDHTAICVGRLLLEGFHRPARFLRSVHTIKGMCEREILGGDLSGLTTDELDVLAFSHRHNRSVSKHIFNCQVRRLAMPDSVLYLEAVQTLLGLVAMSLPVETEELRKGIQMLLRIQHEFAARLPYSPVHAGLTAFSLIDFFHHHHHHHHQPHQDHNHQQADEKAPVECVIELSVVSDPSDMH